MVAAITDCLVTRIQFAPVQALGSVRALSGGMGVSGQFTSVCRSSIFLRAFHAGTNQEFFRFCLTTDLNVSSQFRRLVAEHSGPRISTKFWLVVARNPVTPLTLAQNYRYFW